MSPCNKLSMARSPVAVKMCVPTAKQTVVTKTSVPKTPSVFVSTCQVSDAPTPVKPVRLKVSP